MPILSMINQMWHAVPLIVVISLVYAATRHEEPRPILSHAARLGMWIFIFMAIVFALLWLVSWWL